MRLTELGLPFVALQVPAEPEDRDEMRAAVGDDSIPVLVPDGGEPVRGTDDILEFLSQFPERDDARRHRAMARVDVPNFDEVRRSG
jgi:glutathione S-transferase